MYINNLFYDIIVVRPCYVYNGTELFELSPALGKFMFTEDASDNVKKRVHNISIIFKVF